MRLVTHLKGSAQSSFEWMARAGRSSTFFALLFQGIGGLIQVTAFVFLQGEAYLQFSSAFLVGIVLSIFFALNFENIILGGRFSPSINRYFIFFWLLGLAAVVVGKMVGATSPHFIVYCCWGVCSRILLAWAADKPAEFVRIFLIGVFVAAICWSGDLHYLMGASLLAIPLSAPSILFVPKSPDAGIRAEVLGSFRAFSHYFPHTVSGLMIGYFDRFMALNVVGGAAAEAYLRTIQICSWAAFVCYPLVFSFRNSIVAERRFSRRRGLTIFLSLCGVMISAIVIILFFLHELQRVPATTPLVVALCLSAIVLSQFYQVTSILNFIGERFSVINRITLISGGFSLAFGLLLVMHNPSASSLATMFLAGWVSQVSLTLYFLNKGEETHRSSSC